MPVSGANSISPEQAQVIAKLMAKMNDLGFWAKPIQQISVGPILSAYRFLPSGSTKVRDLEALASDFALALGAEDIMVKRMPGESSVAVFVPNAERRKVLFRDTVGAAMQFLKAKPDSIPLNFGVDYLGKPFIEDLTELPHLLVAGSTGSGKSTLLHSLLGTIVYTLNSHSIRLVLSDTKAVEFGHFIGLPHLQDSPRTTVYQTLEALDNCIDEMEERLRKIGASGERNIKDYNKKVNTKLPYIVIVIDELADIMMFKGEKRGESKIAEEKLQAITQKARAAGIYVIAATQRPSVNVVAGSIKANFPARLTFRLPSETDSRTVIGTAGAEHLLSQGDMLYSSPNRPGFSRLHAPFTSIEDIKAAVDMTVQKELMQLNE